MVSTRWPPSRASSWVRNLKDEVDRRAYHKMLKQLGVSEEDVA